MISEAIKYKNKQIRDIKSSKKKLKGLELQVDTKKSAKCNYKTESWVRLRILIKETRIKCAFYIKRGQQ